jgi:hypothetical protein
MSLASGYISGLTHPSFFRAWSASRHEKRGDRPDGTIDLWSEADPKILGDAMRVAIRLHIDALRLIKVANEIPDRAGLLFWLQTLANYSFARAPGDD